MIWTSIKHMGTTEILARIASSITIAILGSLGIYFASPALQLAAGVGFFLLIYRVRYKRL